MMKKVLLLVAIISFSILLNSCGPLKPATDFTNENSFCLYSVKD
jgi:hypothetical protein